MTPLDQLVRITSALADASRVRLLAACFNGEKCVCQLVELLGLSNATVSKHLSLLRDAGLLASRKEGRWVHYRVPEDPTPAAAEAIGLVLRHAGDGGDGVISADVEQMERILAVHPVELCRMQRAGCCVVESGCGEEAEKNERRAGSPSYQEQENC